MGLKEVKVDLGEANLHHSLVVGTKIIAYWENGISIGAIKQVVRLSLKMPKG
jgi:hypothetical protein